MVKNRSSIRTLARQLLRDEIKADETPDFEDDELDVHINECLGEISQRSANEVKEILAICARAGTATATSASHLVDTTKAHFVAGDVGKTVYNSTDKTIAKVTAYTSATDITLDTDIMASGESYTLYHLDGTSARDLDISSITGLIGDKVGKVEYPTRQYPLRFDNKFTIFGDVLTLGVTSTPTDGDEVFLYCHKGHSLTEAASTLGTDLEEVLVKGVVAYAALAWCADKMRSDVMAASVKTHDAWANKQWVIYQASLRGITPRTVWEF